MAYNSLKSIKGNNNERYFKNRYKFSLAQYQFFVRFPILWVILHLFYYLMDWMTVYCIPSTQKKKWRRNKNKFQQRTDDVFLSISIFKMNWYKHFHNRHIHHFSPSYIVCYTNLWIHSSWFVAILIYLKSRTHKSFQINHKWFGVCCGYDGYTKVFIT